MSGQWLSQQTAPNAVHAVPLDDGIVHEFADDCPCGPATRPTPMPHGATGWITVHYSLDGREHSEEQR